LDPAEYDSIEAMWNSEESQAIREAMLEGKYPSSCPESCPVRNSVDEGVEWFDERLETDTLTDAERSNLRQLRFAVSHGKSSLDATPHVLALYDSFECNVDCIMCWEQYYEEGGVGLETNDYPDYGTFFDRAGVIDYQGGEPLLGETWADLVDTFENHPGKQARLITNGLLLDPDVLRPYLSQIKSISVSLNGATKETHETVNRDSDWQTVLNNIEAFVDTLDQAAGPTPNIYIGMVILPENYYEIPMFAALAENLDVGATFTLGRGDGFEKADDQSVIRYTTPRDLSIKECEQLVDLCETTLADYPDRYTNGLESVLTGIEKTHDVVATA
jgi:molybdenum cofactor biosynthesis enzyme MoaA